MMPGNGEARQVNLGDKKELEMFNDFGKVIDRYVSEGVSLTSVLSVMELRLASFKMAFMPAFSQAAINEQNKTGIKVARIVPPNRIG